MWDLIVVNDGVFAKSVRIAMATTRGQPKTKKGFQENMILFLDILNLTNTFFQIRRSRFHTPKAFLAEESTLRERQASLVQSIPKMTPRKKTVITRRENLPKTGGMIFHQVGKFLETRELGILHKNRSNCTNA